MKYLKQFIIGSSFPVIILFYIIVNTIKTKNYAYNDYTLIAPLWFGLWNVISLFIANKFGLSIKQRFLVISIISYLIIISYSYATQKYKFSKKQWYKYFGMMIILYLLTWNVVIYNIENYLT